jgi:hypothetical protein
MPPNTIVLCEEGKELAFSFDDMCRYNGGGSPGGVAHAFKVLERAPGWVARASVSSSGCATAIGRSPWCCVTVS